MIKKKAAGMEKGKIEKEEWDRFAELEKNGIGNYIKMNREARGYSQIQVCGGICSVSTFSRIEAGEKTVDYLMIEAFLSRMKIERSEYEFVLDNDDYYAYMFREEIELLVKNREYRQAEERMAAYEKKYGATELHGQFLFFQRASLERTKPQPDWEKVKELFIKALTVTMPDYQKKFEQKEILSNQELECIAEIMHCDKNSVEAENGYEALYTYYEWNRRREGFFPPPYRIAMQYYAECLYENGKYDACIQMCSEAMKELFSTGKVENRAELFCLRAKAREKKEIKSEDEKKQCLRDLLTSYHVFSFYKREEEAEALKKHIGEEYGWQFIV